MEPVTLASGEVITLITGWRAWLALLVFAAIIIAAWEGAKSIAKHI